MDSYRYFLEFLLSVIASFLANYLFSVLMK